MADVMIRCPNTGEAVPTGIGMPWEMFSSPGVQMDRNQLRCPACNQMHTWDKKDAFPDS